MSFAVLSYFGSQAFQPLPTLAEEPIAAASHKQAKKIDVDSPRQTVDEVWQIVRHQYVDADFNGVDWEQVRQEYVKDRSYSNNKEAYQAIAQMLDLLNDPLTRFITREEFNLWQPNFTENRAAVGLTINKNKKTGEIEVVSVIPNSPAFTVDINNGDILTKIGDRNLQGMETYEVLALLLGKPDTQVNITVKHNGQETDYHLTRKIVLIEAVKLQVKEVDQHQFAYLKLNNFNRNSDRDLRQAIEQAEAKNVAGYVLDLRGNKGGLFNSSIDIARMWLNEGTIVTRVDRQGTEKSDSAKNNALTDKPVVVLVDKATASGGEILTAALQENKRATIVGEQTYGFGLIRSLRFLNDGSGLEFTIAKFVTPEGNDIEDVGVTPDRKIELAEAEKAKLMRNPEFAATQDDLMWIEAIKVLQEQLQSVSGNL